jgi:hypothetical protein
MQSNKYVLIQNEGGGVSGLCQLQGQQYRQCLEQMQQEQFMFVISESKGLEERGEWK